MIKEILTSRGFSEDEIGTLETREDYEAVKLRIEQLQADSLLDELEARTIEWVETQTLDLETRWERFKAAITALEWWESDTPDTETAEETLDEMRTRLEQEATETAENAIREKFSWIPFIWESIADWLISSGKEYIESNDTSTLWGFKNGIFMFFAWLFGVKGIINTLRTSTEAAWNAELPVPPTTDEVVPLTWWVEVDEEVRNTIKYEAGISLILWFSEEDDNNSNIESILKQKVVQEASFNDVIEQGFVITNIENSDITIMQATLRSQEWLIDSILSSENPDWRELTLLEIFEAISIYTQSFWDLENISAEDILNGNFNIWSLSFWEWGIVWGSLWTLFERYRDSENSVFHWVSEWLLISLYWEANKKISDPDVETLLSWNSFQTKEEDKEFQSEFVSFWRGMVGLFINDFYLWPDEYKIEFETFFRERSLTYREVLELMVLTWGSLDSSSYNEAIKTLLFTRVWKMLWEDPETWNSLRANTYNLALRTAAEGWISNGVENIPPQFIIIWEKLWATVVESVTDVLGKWVDIFGEVWNSMSYWEQATVVWIAWFSIFALIRTRVFRARVAWFWIGLQTALIWWLIFMAQSAAANEDFRRDNPQIQKEADIINLMLREASERGIDLSLAVDDVNSWRSPYEVDGTLIFPINSETVVETEEWNTIVNEEIPLLQDWYEILEETNINIGNTNVIIENWIVSIYYNWNRRNIFFQSTLFAPPASNIINSSPSLVKNDEWEIFISVEAERWEFRYISINEIDNQISSENPEIINVAWIPEYKIYDNFFRGWSLYIDWEPIS